MSTSSVAAGWKGCRAKPNTCAEPVGQTRNVDFNTDSIVTSNSATLNGFTRCGREWAAGSSTPAAGCPDIMAVGTPRCSANSATMSPWPSAHPTSSGGKTERYGRVEAGKSRETQDS